MTNANLPQTQEPTREELLVRWHAARRERDRAELGSEAYRRAVDEIGRIEVEIARIERAMNPPKV